MTWGYPYFRKPPHIYIYICIIIITIIITIILITKLIYYVYTHIIYHSFIYLFTYIYIFTLFHGRNSPVSRRGWSPAPLAAASPCASMCWKNWRHSGQRGSRLDVWPVKTWDNTPWCSSHVKLSEDMYMHNYLIYMIL